VLISAASVPTGVGYALFGLGIVVIVGLLAAIAYALWRDVGRP